MEQVANSLVVLLVVMTMYFLVSGVEVVIRMRIMIEDRKLRTEVYEESRKRFGELHSSMSGVVGGLGDMVQQRAGVCKHGIPYGKFCQECVIEDL